MIRKTAKYVHKETTCKLMEHAIKIACLDNMQIKIHLNVLAVQTIVTNAKMIKNVHNATKISIYYLIIYAMKIALSHTIKIKKKLHIFAAIVAVIVIIA